MNSLSVRGKSEEEERAKKPKGENERRDGEGVGKLADLFLRSFPTCEACSQATVSVVVRSKSNFFCNRSAKFLGALQRMRKKVNKLTPKNKEELNKENYI